MVEGQLCKKVFAKGAGSLPPAHFQQDLKSNVRRKRNDGASEVALFAIYLPGGGVLVNHLA